MADESLAGGDLDIAMLIIDICREDGRAAKLAGKSSGDCPYTEELERAGWLDGWSKA